MRALPRSLPLSFRFSGTPQRHRLSWACVLCPSQFQVAHVARCLVSTLSPGGCCILSTPPSQTLGFLGAQRDPCLRCATCLPWGADLWLRPSWWMSTIQDPRKTWLVTGSLLSVWWRMLSVGQDCPSPSQSGCRLPASLPLAGDVLVHSRLALLWYLLSPLFCEWA